MIVFDIFVTVLCLRMSVAYSAPLQLQFLQPYQRLLMEQQKMIQQKFLELHEIQQSNPIQTQITLNNQFPPLLFFVPEHLRKANNEEKQRNNENIDKDMKLRQHMSTKTFNDDDSDSVVVDAEPVPIIEEQKAFLVLPNTRLSIAGIIESIPFLPIEINVPDTISWVYNGIANGISGIISIIGQRLPFQMPPTEATKGISLKSTINDMQMRKEQQNVMRPVILMPLDNIMTPILPIQL